MTEPLVEARDVEHVYTERVVEPIKALKGISADIGPGDHVAILGANGSGKSTLARHFNGLLLPSAGQVWVDGFDTRALRRDLDVKKHIRATVGLVFQNPDSQIVATIVEDDVAFGPENLGHPREELRRRVDAALRIVGMTEQARRPPHMLSVGQRQRVAIAGVLAMEPRVLIFDEATAMLDPLGRRAVMEVMEELHRSGIGVVQVTHHMDEAAHSDDVLVLADGELAAQGTPAEVLTDPDRLRALSLDVPPTVAIARRVADHVDGFPTTLLSVEQLVEEVAGRTSPDGSPPPIPDPISASPSSPIIEVEDLSHTYMEGTPLEHQAIHDVSLFVEPGEIVGILGHTGCGKSTTIQHLNALLRPQTGRVRVAGFDLFQSDLDPKAVRAKVGLMFQRPEDQLFERYVGDDVAFGPVQFGLEGEALRDRVRWAMGLVGLEFGEFKDRPIFSLSGGEARRAALAGVLALHPEILVLDEPTAGLDPRTRDELLDTLGALRRQEGITIVLVTHNMGEVAELADRVYVMGEGTVVASDTPRGLFARPDALRKLGLDLPVASEIVHRLRERGVPLSADRATEDEVADDIVRILRADAAAVRGR